MSSRLLKITSVLCVVIFFLAAPAAKAQDDSQPPVGVEKNEEMVPLPYGEGITPQFLNELHGYGDRWPGEDYVTPCGTPLYNPLPGQTVVVRVGFDGFVGPYGSNNSFLLLTNGQYNYMLMHGSYSVSAGQKLSQGDQIGVEASIGNSTHCHSHISIRDGATDALLTASSLQVPVGSGWDSRGSHEETKNTSAGAEALERLFNYATATPLLLGVVLVAALLIAGVYYAISSRWPEPHEESDFLYFLRVSAREGFPHSLKVSAWTMMALAIVTALSVPQLRVRILRGLLETFAWLGGDTTLPNWLFIVWLGGTAVFFWLMRKMTYHRLKDRWGRWVSVVLWLALATAMWLWLLSGGKWAIPSLTDLFERRVTQVSPLTGDQLPFPYWNGNLVTLRVPDPVWDAVLRASADLEKGEGLICNENLVLALAHSESSTFTNNVCSGAGACGTWQFMPGTFPTYADPGADRFDRYDSAKAACRMTSRLGLDKETTEAGFIANFTGTDGSLVWNQHEGQARYVWRLWQWLNDQS